MQYRKQDLYDDVRNCIREGLSVKETANLCGCREHTVANWTKDLRSVKTRRPRANNAELEAIRSEYEDLLLTTGEIAKRHGYTDKNAITNMVSRKGWKRKDGARPVRGGYISNQVDITALNVEARKRAEAKPVEQEIAEVEEVKPEAPAMPVNNPIEGSDLFKNFAASFDGETARYSVRMGQGVRVMVGDSSVTIPMDAIDGITRELAEIWHRFGGVA